MKVPREARRALPRPGLAMLAILLVCVAACALGQQPVGALGWRALKNYLQPGVRILQEDEQRLVLGLEGDPDSRLVLTLEPRPESSTCSHRTL